MYDNWKICPKCGAEAEREDQKFCTKCGARFEEPRYSPYTEDEYNADRAEEEPVQQVNKPVQGMKWYLFLVTVYMTFVAIMNVLNSFLYFTGNYAVIEELTPAEYYAKYGAVMKGVDVAYGVILVGGALWMFLLRLRMMKFRKNAPALYLTYYAVTLVVEAGYYIGSILIKKAPFTLNDVMYVTALVITYVVYIILNAVYFKKRAKLFVN